MAQVTHDQVIREFWAAYLESDVAKDGAVKGFSAWWDRTDPQLRAEAQRMELLCWRRVKAGASVTEAVADSVRELVRWQEHRVRPRKARPGYVTYRLGLRERIRHEGLRPFEVAAMLELAMAEHPEIPIAEIDAYRAMGEEWQPWQGFDFDYAANREAWAGRGRTWDELLASMLQQRNEQAVRTLGKDLPPANEDWFRAHPEVLS